MKKLIICFLILSLLLTGCGELLYSSVDTPSTEAPAASATTPVTEAPSEPTTAPPTETPTEPATIPPTEPATVPPTEAPTEHIHDYQAATCTSPKICATCGDTAGDPTGHSWKSATCTEPRKCSLCKETDGEAAGHNWKKATCTAPKTCSKCEQTSGSATAHDYADGACSSCGKSDPDYSYSGSTMVWIPTKGGKKYHTHSDCSNMIDPDYVTLEEAEDLGFTPCKRCH